MDQPLWSVSPVLGKRAVRAAVVILVEHFFSPCPQVSCAIFAVLGMTPAAQRPSSRRKAGIRPGFKIYPHRDLADPPDAAMTMR